MKTKATFLSTVLASLLLISFAVPIIIAGDIDYGPNGALIPSNGEMFGWIKDMWEIGDRGRYGYRMPGTRADHEGAEYVLQKFQEFGLKDTYLEPVPIPVSFPDEWSLTINVGGEDVAIPVGFMRYAAFTPPEGITAEMVYVGTGSGSEFEAVNNAVGVAGKIVVVDLIAPGLPTSIFDLFSLYTYDPENTLPGDKVTENWPIINIAGSYSLANTYGAVGYIGILTFMANNIHEYLHWYADGSLPGLYVSPNDGAYLRSLLEAGPVEATMVLTGFEGQGVTYNVYGFLPGKKSGKKGRKGKKEEIIVVLSHHDGWATNEASGTAVVLALAKYFAQFPPKSRERTLMFLGIASHFGKRPDLLEQCELLASLKDKVVYAINIEMISKQYKVIDGEFVETGLISPRVLFISGPEPGTANPYVLDYAIEAITKYDLDRTNMQPMVGLFPSAPGEGGRFHDAGIPAINFIAHNAPQFTSEDTPDTVMVDALKPTTAAFIDIIGQIDATSAEDLRS